jgi:cytochrome P450
MTSQLKVAVGVAAALAAVAVLRRRRRADGKKPPASDPSGFVDLCRLIRAGSLGVFYAQRRSVLGDTFSVTFPSKGVVFTNVDDVIAITALENRLNMSIKMPPAYEALHGQDLQLTKGSAHKIWRRTLSAVVSPRALESYLPRIVDAFGDMWISLAALGGEEVVLRDHIRRAQLRVMADILFGITFEGIDGEAEFQKLDEDFEQEVDALFALPLNIPGTKFYKGMKAARRIRELLATRFKEELQRFSSSDVAATVKSKERPLRNAIEAVVEMLRSSDPEVRKIGNDETLVVNNLLLLLEASHGTTMYATSALLAELHRPENVDALAQLREEVAAVTSSGASLDVKSVGSMTYASACINEILRLYPFAGSIPKFLPPGEVLDVRGARLEGPTDVMLSFSHAFVDADIFPDPLAFRPQRWLDTCVPERLRVSETARKTFMPMGLGSHICLGESLARLSMKSMLIAYCQGSFDMRLVGQLERVPDIIPEWKVKDGVRARVYHRVQGA